MGNPNGRKTHGMYYSSEHKSWNNMKQRCTNPNSTYWKHYGGRGIKVCARWKKFENFYADMGPKPSPSHSLDRINNNLGYNKKNCRWATKVEQSRNTRVTKRYLINGEFLVLNEISIKYGINYAKLKSRVLREKYPIEKAVFGILDKRIVKRKMPKMSNHPERMKTHCKFGHIYNDENTYVSPIGHRGCRICRKRNRKDTYNRSINRAKDILGGE